MSDDTQQPIVVKKIKKGGGAAHGGAWKIAYADFVTAMMAFFLLMWLLGSTTQGDLKGIADHFNTPLKVAMLGGSGAGSSNSILTGGGMDLSSSTGQKKRAAEEAQVNKANLEKAKAAFEKAEKGKLEKLKAEIEAMIEASAALRPFKNQLLLDLTEEGLRIQIIDEKNRPMFDSASSELKPHTRVILRSIGAVLNKVDNRISLSGHTDAQPYAGGDVGFGNWELSTNRANSSRRELVAGGLIDAKVMRVVGLASTVRLVQEDPFDPTNRRISIVVLNKRTEESILADGRLPDVDTRSELTPEATPPSADVGSRSP